MLDRVLDRHEFPVSRLMRSLEGFREPFARLETKLAAAKEAALETYVRADLNRFYGIEGEAPVGSSSEVENPVLAIEDPMLKLLTPDALRRLLELSFEGGDSSRLQPWASALLRGSELNQGRLVPRFRALWNTNSVEALRSALYLGNFLENIGAASRDLRYLNAALKIVDELPAMPLHRGRLESWEDLLLLRLVTRLRVQIETECA